jgi:hypothetical protein
MKKYSDKTFMITTSLVTSGLPQALITSSTFRRAH